MNFVAVATISAVVPWPPVQQKSSFDWFMLHSPLFK